VLLGRAGSRSDLQVGLLWGRKSGLQSLLSVSLYPSLQRLDTYGLRPVGISMRLRRVLYNRLEAVMIDLP